MNLKRFMAEDVRAAMAMVREDLGPDAVILSNRKVPGGIEIVAAMDYDESLVSRPASPAREFAEPVPVPAASTQGSRPAELVFEAEPAVDALHETGSETHDWDEIGDLEQVARQLREPAPRMDWPADPAMQEMRNEVAEMRKLLELQLASLSWNEHARNEPGRAMILRELTALDLCPELARSLVKDLPKVKDMRSAMKAALGLLAGKIPVAESELMEEGGVVAVVGPTGVGKTTSVVKIAARFALRHGPDSVGLISTDNYRIGAREQLLTFARILGVPMHTARNAEELQEGLDRLSQRKLVLIDTAGMSQRDVRLAAQFQTLQSCGANVKTLLAVSAASEIGALREIIQAFSAAAPVGCVLTKMDEAASIGAALSALIESELPLMFLADGQRIPEDFHLAAKRRVWLVREALRLKERTGKKVTEQTMAEKYGTAVING